MTAYTASFVLVVAMATNGTNGRSMVIDNYRKRGLWDNDVTLWMVRITKRAAGRKRNRKGVRARASRSCCVVHQYQVRTVAKYYSVSQKSLFFICHFFKSSIRTDHCSSFRDLLEIIESTRPTLTIISQCPPSHEFFVPRSQKMRKQENADAVTVLFEAFACLFKSYLLFEKKKTTQQKHHDNSGKRRQSK